MRNTFSALSRTTNTPTCSECEFYQNARTVSAEFPDEVEEACLDGRTMICGNCYSANFIEEVDENNSCESFSPADA